MNISIDQAQAFCAIVDCGGYTKAAHQLNKSHSSLVYLIRSLEQQCELELFDRQGYRNTLTAAGERIFVKCKELLLKVRELESVCEQLHNNWEPSLKIVFDGILPFEPFLELYKTFRTEKIPTIVQTYTNYLEDVEKSFYDLSADMMISILPIKKSRLKSFELETFKSFLVAHKDHPIHQKPHRWTVEELQQFFFFTVRSSAQHLGLNTEEFEESASFYLSDFSAKKSAILKKAGFGWLPEHLIEKELRQKILLPLKWERSSVQTIKPHLYIHSQKNDGRATQLILNWFRSQKAF